MKLINEYPVKVFENKYEDKKYYKLGLSKKDQNGNYMNGYIDCRFRKDADVDVSKKIYISMLKIKRQTHMYLLISSIM